MFLGLQASDVTERPSSSVCGPKSLPNTKPISPKAVSVTKASTKRHDATPKAASERTKGSSLSANSKTKVDAKRYLIFYFYFHREKYCNLNVDVKRYIFVRPNWFCGQPKGATTEENC